MYLLLVLCNISTSVCLETTAFTLSDYNTRPSLMCFLCSCDHLNNTTRLSSVDHSTSVLCLYTSSDHRHICIGLAPLIIHSLSNGGSLWILCLSWHTSIYSVFHHLYYYTLTTFIFLSVLHHSQNNTCYYMSSVDHPNLFYLWCLFYFIKCWKSSVYPLITFICVAPCITCDLLKTAPWLKYLWIISDFYCVMLMCVSFLK